MKQYLELQKLISGNKDTLINKDIFKFNTSTDFQNTWRINDDHYNYIIEGKTPKERILNKLKSL